MILANIYTVRTRFGLNPKTGMDPSPQSPSNKFVECRIKSQSGSRTKILGYNVKERAMEPYQHKKYPRTCPNAIILESSSPLSFLPPSSYILWLFYRFLHPRVGQAFKVLFLHPSCLIPFLTGRLRVHCSGITSTLMRPEGQLGGI